MNPLTDYRAWLSPRRAPFWLVILAVAYTLAGFLLVPWLLQRQLPALAAEYVQRDATVTDVRFNPWTLALEADELGLYEDDRSPIVTLAGLRLNLQLSSLFRRALVFSEVRLAAPAVNLVRDAVGDTNVGRLLADASGPAATDETPSEPLRLVVQNLQIAEGRMDVTDRVPATPFNTRLQDINIDVQNLSTLPNVAGQQKIVITTEGDGLIDWTGTVQIRPFESAGRIEIRAPGLPLLTRYLDDVLDFDLDGGVLELVFDYRVGARRDGQFDIAVDGLGLNITATEMATEDSAEPILGFANLRADGGTLRWPEGRARIEEIVIAAPSLNAWLNADNSLNLARLLETGPAEAGAPATGMPEADASGDAGDDAPGAAPDSEPPAAAAEATAAAPAATADAAVAAATPPDAAAPADPGGTQASEPSSAAGAAGLALSLGRLRIDAMSARFEDRSLGDPAAIDVRALNFDARELSNAPGALFPFELSLELGSGGSLGASGEAGFLPDLNLDATLEAEQVQLPVIQPWLSTLARLSLDAGALNATTRLRSSPQEPLDLRGDVTVDEVLITDTAGERLASWAQLGLRELIFELTAGQLEIARARLRDPYARIVIDANREVNLARLAVPAETGDDQAGEPADTGRPLVFRMGRSRIDGGRVDFADLSLPLPFETRIQEFSGSMSALASDTRQPSDLDFEGRVGEFGQAKVTGQLIALDPLAAAQVRVAFRNVNMPDLSPYSVDFAGRKIAAGKLALDLDYRFEQNKLLGENEITVEKLRLGDKVDNPDALDLPLGLAVALLSDSNGVIDLKLTIEGDVDDPEFSARGIIAKALANLLIKAVSSPFRLLGSLVGGDEDLDLQNIGFEPGRSALTPPQEEKLTQLAAALAQRPALRLTVPGAYAAEVDTLGLQQASLDATLLAAVEASDAREALLAERARDALESLARERLPALSLRELAAQFRVEDEDPETPDFDTLAYLTELRSRLVAVEPVDEAQLAALGDARAAAVQDYLATQAALPANRVAVAPAEPVEAGGADTVLLQLAIDATQMAAPR